MIREKAQAEAKAIRDKAEADAKAAEQARKDAEQEAERLKVAALEQAKSAQSAVKTPAPAASGDKPTDVASLPPPNAPAGSPLDIARSLQTELRRVGCFSGNIDGEWKAASQRSLEQFNKGAGLRLDVKLASTDALDAVKAKSGRVCPLVCDHGFRANGDKCEKIVCRAGYAVGEDNTCERVEPKQRRAKPSEPTTSQSGSGNLAPADNRRNAASNNGVGQQVICGGPNSAAPCRPVAKGCHLRYGFNGVGALPVEVCN